MRRDGAGGGPPPTVRPAGTTITLLAPARIIWPVKFPAGNAAGALAVTVCARGVAQQAPNGDMESHAPPLPDSAVAEYPMAAPLAVAVKDWARGLGLPKGLENEIGATCTNTSGPSSTSMGT